MPKGVRCEQTSKVLKWLSSIPEVDQGTDQAVSDRDADLGVVNALADIHLTCDDECEIQTKLNKHCRELKSGTDSSNSMLFLQGSPCNINTSRSKHTKASKKVTFQFSNDTCENQEDSNTLMDNKRGKPLEEDRFMLVRNMQDYLREVAKKKRCGKQCTRNQPYIRLEQPTSGHMDKVSQEDEIDQENNDNESSTLDRKLGTDKEPEFDDVICEGRHGASMLFSTDFRKASLPGGIEYGQTLQSRVRLPLWGAKVPHLYRKSQVKPRSAEKPLIKGLVVDAATNQQPSIVRASKNANIREEHALKVRIGGYEKECNQNINTIRLAQRKLNTNLSFLKTKMAATSAARAKTEMEMLKQEEKQMLSLDDDTTGLPAMPMCFPPLVYRSRRVLTVS